MNRYWLGITAGALAVFGVGMTGITLGRKGLEQLKTAAAAGPARLLQGPLGVLRFRLDGERIGRVAELEVESDGDWTGQAVSLTVVLEDPSLAAKLKACAIAGEQISGPRDDARFRCLSSTEVESERLVQIGEVRFEPIELSRPLYMAERDRRHLARSDLRHLRAHLRSTDGETVSGQATFDLARRRGRVERGVVNLHAGDGRALIDIRDESGRRLFHLNADEGGVSVRASDRAGRELLRLLAGEAGVSLKVGKEP
jgi:hypothetical protein